MMPTLLSATFDEVAFILIDMEADGFTKITLENKNPLAPFVLFNNGIGDHLLALPTLRALAHVFAGRLSLICDEHGPLFLLKELPLASLIPIPFWRSGRARVFDSSSLLLSLQGCDLFISLVPWTSPSLFTLARTLGNVLSIGLAPGFNINLGSADRSHAVDAMFRIVNMIEQGRRPEDFALPPSLPAICIQEARSVRSSRTRRRKLLVVHMETSGKKRWLHSELESTCFSFLELHPDFDIVFVGMLPPPISTVGFEDRIVHCCGLSLAVTFALIAETDLFLGIDSCMLHAADICRVPSVGLFGPTLANEWGLRFGSGICVQGTGSLLFIKADTVLRALDCALASSDINEIWNVNVSGVVDERDNPSNRNF
jgi:ADP-heptose:LPS heptosyltransferase